MIIAERLERIKPSPTLAVEAKVKEMVSQGIKVISLGAGKPDFPTPDNVKLAGIKAIVENKTDYTEVSGIKPLKEAICGKLKRENNLSYEIKNIIVSTGAKQVIFNCLMAGLNSGDEVIIPAPYWVSYPDMVLMAEGVPVIAECKSENNFKLKAEDLEKVITKKSRWVILNFPGNPSGAIMNEEDLKEIADLLKKHPDINIISDDIYEHIIFGGNKFCSILEVEPSLKERTILVNGTSKSHSMTGWRLGYAAGPEDFIKAMEVIQSQSTSNTCSISQYAATEALNGDQSFLEFRSKSFEKRCEYVFQRLKSMKYIDVQMPGGAFYIFPSCKLAYGKKTPQGKSINSCVDFCDYLMDEVRVAVVPGSAFGAEGFFRISYATSLDLLEEAMNKIEEAVSKLK
jgi:aspartate aminotransferase